MSPLEIIEIRLACQAWYSACKTLRDLALFIGSHYRAFHFKNRLLLHCNRSFSLMEQFSLDSQSSALVLRHCVTILKGTGLGGAGMAQW